MNLTLAAKAPGMTPIDCAIIGSGNIGTDLLLKIKRLSKVLRVRAMVGIDPASDGLQLAQREGVPTTARGINGLLAMPEFVGIRIVFDATSAYAHAEHEHRLRAYPDKTLIDLTPAAIGPYVVPVVNLDTHINERVMNLVSCGGQATIPMVAAVSRCAKVHYAEIVASISSRSAGPGTRANIDEFTATTARGLEQVGGAERAKAIIVLNPAEPPMMMRNTVFTLSAPAKQADVEQSVADMVANVQSYVRGYRLKQTVVFDEISPAKPLTIPGHGQFHGLKTSVFLEVSGAADYLPAYAGNLDIMTSAALGTAERVARAKYLRVPA
jgi:acetaldehyde dehydrogenase